MTVRLWVTLQVPALATSTRTSCLSGPPAVPVCRCAPPAATSGTRCSCACPSCCGCSACTPGTRRRCGRAAPARFRTQDCAGVTALEYNTRRELGLQGLGACWSSAFDQSAVASSLMQRCMALCPWVWIMYSQWMPAPTPLTGHLPHSPHFSSSAHRVLNRCIMLVYAKLVPVCGRILINVRALSNPPVLCYPTLLPFTS